MNRIAVVDRRVRGDHRVASTHEVTGRSGYLDVILVFLHHFNSGFGVKVAAGFANAVSKACQILERVKGGLVGIP